MSTAKVTIDGIQVEVPQDTTIIKAAKEAGINIPTLCYHEDLKPTANCGVCVVEIEGSPVPKRACCTPVWDGMVLKTNSKNLRSLRKTIVELTLANHEVVCPTCVANGACELQKLSFTLGIDPHTIPTLLKRKTVDESSWSIVRDVNKCINCGRCIYVCNELQTVNALTFADRGFESHVDTAFGLGIGNSACVNCGQCTVFCPTGALREKDNTDLVWDALLDPEKHVVIQEAPSIRVALGEEFGMEPGEAVPGKMYAAIKRLGFDAIFDTNFSADLTIIEEGSELVKRIKEGGPLPLLTSCSPGWVKFCETYFPDFGQNLSTAKSPMEMMGPLTKTFYPEKTGIDPKKIVSVAIMPCTAKKFEANRPEMKDSGFQDVDIVLTTREFVRMIKEAGIDFKNLPEEKPSDFLSEYTGAATIFGATGGVMEAAIRSAYWLLTEENLKDLDVCAVRGMEGVKEATLTIPAKGIGELPVKVAVAHGLGNARKLLDKVRAQIKETGKSEYAFIEVMACPGGCAGGGGQPYTSTFARRARRGEGLYKEDKSLPKRCSHENPSIWKLYEDFLGQPGGEKAHKLLHTNYYQRSEFDGSVEKEVTHKHH